MSLGPSPAVTHPAEAGSGGTRPLARAPRVGRAGGAAILAAVVVMSIVIGLASGSTGLGLPQGDVLWQIRLPRVLAGFGAGAALALAGALLQQVSRNALADPYVMGVSSGAAVAALAWILLGGVAVAALGLPEGWAEAWRHPAAVSAAAAVGALLAMAVLLALSWRLLARNATVASADTPVAVLLLGVMIGSGGTAVIGLLLALAPEAQLRGMVFWLLGDLNGALHWGPVWVATAFALWLVGPQARALDWLARGEAWAATVGVEVAALQRRVLAAAALATGAAVATAGAIGFVGLVVPHVLRLTGWRRSATLLPAAAAGGGAFVVVADAMARTLFAPLQLPVGVVCAAVGVPVFIVLLLRGSGAVRAR
jgi:iron complex transport system permease protein